MSPIKKAGIGVAAFYCLLALIFFRSYFFKGLVPFPANLLVSFYSPWRNVSWPGYPNGVPNKPMGTDNLRLFYPYRKFTTEELEKGRLPLWNPYAFSGNIHLATYQSAVLYPLNIVYHVLPLVDAWSILVIISPIIAGLGTYLFLRALLLSKKSSLFGSIVFAFSGLMIAWWEENIVLGHTMIWLPFALFGVTSIWNKKNRMQGFCVLTLSLSLSGLAGFLHLSLYVFGTTMAWAAFLFITKKDSEKSKIAVKTAAACIFALGITALQWVPALEAYLLSPRISVESTFLFELFLMPPWHLVTLLAPDFWGNPGTYNYFYPIVSYHEKAIFIGIVPLLFVLSVVFQRKSPALVFWTIFSIVAFSLGFALPTSWIWYILKIPVLSSGLPIRIFILSAFGFSILAGFGMERFLERKSIKMFVVPMALIAIAFIGLWIFVLLSYLVVYQYEVLNGLCRCLGVPGIQSAARPYATVSFRNLIIPSGFYLLTVISFLLIRKPHRLYVFFLGMTLGSSLLYANKFLYFSSRQFVYPELPALQTLKTLAGVNRIWGYGNGYIEKNIPTYFGLYSPEGYDALFPREYGDLLSTIQSGDTQKENVLRTDADLKAASEKEPLGDNPYRLRLLSLLGVKYILESKTGDEKDFIPREKRFPPYLFHLAWEDESFRIWEYIDAFPRAFIASSYSVVGESKTLIQKLFDPETDLSSVVLLEKDPGIGTADRDRDTDAEGTVAITRYESTVVELEARVRRPSMLFLSDTYYPGWRAFIDGEETPIYKANYAFRSVPVSPGVHTIRFIYDPFSVTIGMWMTIVSFIIFVVGVVVIRRNDRRILGLC